MRVLIAILLLSGCRFGTLPPTTPPTECSAGQHAWNDYHLSDLSPVIDNRSGYTPDLASWNDLGTQITLRAKGAGFAIVIEEGGDKYSGWLGLASVKVNGAGHIQRATVTMNRTLLDRYGPRVAAHVLCQEVGHLLGLEHQRGADDSCMDDCNGRGSGWRVCLEDSVAGTTPNAHDRDQLIAIYDHAAEAPPPPACMNAEEDIVIHRFGTEGSEHER